MLKNTFSAKYLEISLFDFWNTNLIKKKDNEPIPSVLTNASPLSVVQSLLGRLSWVKNWNGPQSLKKEKKYHVTYKEAYTTKYHAA